MDEFEPKPFAESLASVTRPGTVTAFDLGRVSFAPMAAAQAAYLALRREAPQRAHDVVLFLEHEPVYTVSRRTNAQHLLWTPEQRKQRNVTVAEVDRGGDITFHGPGQIVAYPLLDLEPLRLGSSAYMQGLERLVVETLATLQLDANVQPGMPGVWVYDPAHATEAKICAIGTRVSRGLTKHGLALNHTVDLDYFTGIVPCGLSRPVTSLAALQGEATVSRRALLERLAAHFARTFKLSLQWSPATPLGLS